MILVLSCDFVDRLSLRGDRELLSKSQLSLGGDKLKLVGH
jgi:hypothetical protein